MSKRGIWIYAHDIKLRKVLQQTHRCMFVHTYRCNCCDNQNSNDEKSIIGRNLRNIDSMQIQAPIFYS